MDKKCKKCNKLKKLHSFPKSRSFSFGRALARTNRFQNVCHQCRYGKQNFLVSKKLIFKSYEHQSYWTRLILEERIIKQDGCWGWKGSKNRHGYGEIKVNRIHMNASRAAWIAYKSEIPENMYVLHTCDNRACCNPEHLWLGTAKDNMQDMIKKGRNKNLKGSACPWATINEDIVLDILDMLKKNINTREIAKKYNIKLSMISDIKTGHRWTHVGDRTGINVVPNKRKLTKFDVIDIKKRIKNGDKLRSIAHDYGIAESSVGDIKAERTWKNIVIT